MEYLKRSPRLVDYLDDGGVVTPPGAEADDGAATVYLVEGRGYAWFAWGPVWAPSADADVGLEPTAEAARAAADAWLADYCAQEAP